MTDKINNSMGECYDGVTFAEDSVDAINTNSKHDDPCSTVRSLIEMLLDTPDHMVQQHMEAAKSEFVKKMCKDLLAARADTAALIARFSKHPA